MAKIYQSLNTALNHAEDLSKPVNPVTGEAQGWVGRTVKPRLFNAFNTAPREVGLIAANTFGVVLATPAAVIKTVIVKPIAFISSSQAVKDFNDKLPSLTAVLKTVARIIQLVVGLASTVLFGVFLSPSLNFKAHIALGLAKDLRKEEAAQAVVEDSIRVEAVREGSAATVSATPANTPRAASVSAPVELKSAALEQFLQESKEREAAIQACFDEIDEELAAKRQLNANQTAAVVTNDAGVAQAAAPASSETPAPAAREGEEAPAQAPVVNAEVPAEVSTETTAARAEANAEAVSTETNSVIVEDEEDVEDEQEPVATPGWIRSGLNRVGDAGSWSGNTFIWAVKGAGNGLVTGLVGTYKVVSWPVRAPINYFRGSNKAPAA